MATLNLIPVLDALGGTTTTPAVFKAEARRAGRRATRVTGAEVAFATELIAVWDGAAWNTPPTLYALPTDCYWNVKVQASGNRLELNGILPDSRDRVDFGDLIAITPETGTADTATIAQYQAVQRYVSNQVGHVDATAATIFDTVATVQAQINVASVASAAATDALTETLTAQAGLAADLAVVEDSRTAAATSATTAAESASDAAAAAAAATAGSTTASAAAIAAALSADAADASATSAADALTAVDATVATAVAGILDGAPAALDTLNELAAAINDDASYAAAVTAALATKAPLASPAFTGTVTGVTKAMVGLGAVANLAPADLPVSTAQAAADAAVQAYTIQRGNHTGTQPASTITGLAAVATSGAYTALTGRPTLAPVATSGAYTDLTNLPTVIDGNA